MREHRCIIQRTPPTELEKTICIQCRYHFLKQCSESGWNGGTAHWTENMCHRKETRNVFENFVTGNHTYRWRNCCDINKGACEYFSLRPDYNLRTYFAEHGRSVL